MRALLSSFGSTQTLQSSEGFTATTTVAVLTQSEGEFFFMRISFNDKVNSLESDILCPFPSEPDGKERI